MQSEHDIGSLQALPRIAAKKLIMNYPAASGRGIGKPPRASDLTDAASGEVLALKGKDGRHLEAAIMLKVADTITERGFLGEYPTLEEGKTYSIFRATQIYLGAIKSSIADLKEQLEDLSPENLAEQTWEEKL